jgi:hypothetical protein
VSLREISDQFSCEHYGYFEVDSVEEAGRIFHDSLDKRWFIEEIEIQELPENIVLANEA